MCDDHGHGSPGPRALDWGRSTILFGVLVVATSVILWKVPSLPGAVERILSIAVGPLLVLAGWSLSEFVRAGSDGIAVRFSAIAMVVSGATLGLTQFVESVPLVQAMEVGWSLWLSFGAIALGLAVLKHPLFGTAFGWIGVGLGVVSIGWIGAGLPASLASSGWFHPLLALAVWYGGGILRTGRAVRRMSRGYAGWPEPALV